MISCLVYMDYSIRLSAMVRPRVATRSSHSIGYTDPILAVSSIGCDLAHNDSVVEQWQPYLGLYLRVLCYRVYPHGELSLHSWGCQSISYTDVLCWLSSIGVSLPLQGGCPLGHREHTARHQPVCDCKTTRGTKERTWRKVVEQPLYPNNPYP